MITYLDTLNVTNGMPVFSSGEGCWADMEGTVSTVDVQNDLINVKWTYPDGHRDTLTYDASHFQDTTDRDGTAWLVLDL